MIIGTAGHIDHGKTALVKALTGVDADRLQEEKARGMTIDLGFAYTPLANGEILGFVDVPGHEKFVHNMLAGATGIDFALLVVAADDGVMPQTQEHLQIIDLLGIQRGAVALTKVDRVEHDRITALVHSIRGLVDNTCLTGCPVFPVSAKTGTGMAELRAYLDSSACAPAPRERDNRKGFRLAIDRCFAVAGFGTVVTGTVFSGRVAVGDRLLLSPAGKPVRVRGIHAQNRPAETGLAGQRCALNLTGVEKREVRRGDWILAPQLHLPSIRLDVRLRLSGSEPRALRHWTPVHVHIGAAHLGGRVALFNDEPLEPGGSVYAQLVLDKPACAAHGDRFILRDACAQRTLAGGRVLDAKPPLRGRRNPERLALLAAWERETPQAILQALLDCSPNGVEWSAFARNLGYAHPEKGYAGFELSPPPCIIDSPTPVLFSAGRRKALRRCILDHLAQEHEKMPDSLGLNSEQLRLRTAPGIERAAFVCLLNELQEEGFCVLDGSWWRLPGHSVTLAEEDEKLWRRIAPLLQLQPFQPPRVRDIARAESLEEGAVRKLMMRVARTGKIYRIAHDHYFDRAAVRELADIVRTLAAEAEGCEVRAAQFRDRTGTGRKLAIHILEFFDRTGFTRRFKDLHRLRNDTLAF